MKVVNKSMYLMKIIINILTDILNQLTKINRKI
jgi:hypothetical protein